MKQRKSETELFCHPDNSGDSSLRIGITGTSLVKSKL